MRLKKLIKILFHKFISTSFIFLIIFSQTRGSLVGYIFLFIFYLFLPRIKIWKKAIIIFVFLVPFISLNIIDEFTSKNLRVDQNRYKTTLDQLFYYKNGLVNANDVINDTSLESINNNNKSYSLSSEESKYGKNLLMS